MAIYTCRACGWAGEVNGRQRCLACYRRRVDEWRRNNPEKRKAQKSRYDKKFRAERPELYRARKRQYYLPRTAARQYQKRAEWLRSGDVTAEQLKAIFRLFGGKCVYCGIPIRPRYSPNDPRGFDHVKSRQSGGKHTAQNLVPCCRNCNQRKG